VLVAVTLALGAGFINDFQNWGDDWAQYLLQARAIRDGQVAAYVAANAVMVNQSSMQVGPVAYPWGLPVLLAAQSYLGGFELSTFKIFNLATLALLVVLVSVYAKRLGSEAPVVSAALVGLSPVWLQYVNHILTELPFTAIGVAWFVTRTIDAPTPATRTLRSVALGLLVFLAVTFRVNGALLMAAGFLDTVLIVRSHRERTMAAAIGAATELGAFIAAYWLWTAVLPDENSSHLRLFEKLSVDLVVANLVSLPSALFSFFTLGRWPGAAIVFAPLVLLGITASWPRSRVAVLYALATLSLYVIWPAGQAFRFMMPLMPLLAIFVVLGTAPATSFGRSVPGRLARAGVLALPVLFFMIAVGLVASGRTSREAWHPYDAPSREMFEWIQQNTAADDVVAFFKPRAMHLLGDRLSITAMAADAPRASYLVYGKRSEWVEFQQGLDDYRSSVTLLPRFENQNFIVFAVTPHDR
jgi:hypothetical protein